MFRFHSRCLPLNYLHNKDCPLCNMNMKNDPYRSPIIPSNITDITPNLDMDLQSNIQRRQNFKLSSSKDSLSICNKNEYINQIKNIKKQIIKEYCIPIIALPNREIFDQFL
ncbi:hypothetical protein ACTFIT_012363 [Dictyostelium discoideum]